MKKPFLISTSFLTILASIGSVTNVLATEIIDGQQWWTMDELRAVVSEMEIEAEAECKDDYKCRKNFYKEIVASDMEKATANVFSGFEFMVSDIVPAEQTVRFLFQGRPRLQYRKANSQHYIDKLYIGWLDEENWETAGENYDDLLASFNGETKNGAMHYLFLGSNEEGNVPEPDEYLDIVLGEDFDRIDGRIYYIVQYKDGEGVWGSFSFENFYNGGIFEVDKEYELKFSGTSIFGFLEKNNNEADEYEDVELVDDIDECEDVELLDDDVKDDINSETDGLGSLIEASEKDEVNKDGEIIVREILAPDTGIVKK